MAAAGTGSTSKRTAGKGKAPRPVTPDERARVVQLHGEGASLGAIARDLGRSRSTVHRIAEGEGLSWDRAQTAAATGAKVADARALRAEQALGLIADAQRLRERLFSPYRLISFGGSDHVRREVELDEPQPADQRALMSAATTALTTSMRLDDHDSDQGAGQAVSMLGAMFTRLVEGAGTYEHPEDVHPTGGTTPAGE